MRLIKRALFFLLALTLALTLFGCADEYPAVRSTKQERETVFTVDGEYEVPYELYRFAFLNAMLAEGDVSKMTEDERAAAYAASDQAARKEIAYVYTVFSLCEKYELDPYSKEIDTAVKEELAESIEMEVGGFGDYETYLKALKESYMNDSVFRFYLRFRLCEERLTRKMRSSGFVDEADENIIAHFLGDETVRATWIYIPYSSTAYENYTKEMLDELVQSAAAASDAAFVSMAQQQLQMLYMPDELAVGYYFGHYSNDPYYEALTETAFSLSVGETSALIHSGDGVYIVRRLAKDEAYIQSEENIELLRETYLLDHFYRVLEQERARLLTAIEEEKAYRELSYADIKMGE